MISRRNIRVKVMQLLYGVETGAASAQKSSFGSRLDQQFDRTESLFVYLVHIVTEVARYAEADARNRASRNLPSQADLNVNTKMAGNESLWKILEHDSYRQAAETHKPANIDSREWVRKLYQELTALEAYIQYISVQGRDRTQERDVLVSIFTDLILPNEDFLSFVEEQFGNWEDDSEMLSQLVVNYLKKPGSFDLQEMLGDDKRKFAHDLLEAVLDKKDYLTSVIAPKLKNWDPERIAVLDMILMRMGVAEFLYFDTIPPKVTINEYIDIAKDYSTAQSGQFINGILDGIHKDLLAQNKIHKVDHRQIAK